MSEIQDFVPIVQSKYITDKIVLLTIFSPQIASAAQPGQFVMVKCTSQNDPLLRRPFSIYNTSIDGSFQILYKIIGRGTELLSIFKEGQKLDILGPLGKGFDLNEPEDPFCLVGGGIGIAPLYLFAKKYQSVHGNDNIVLLGAASGNELIELNNNFLDLGLEVYCATDDGSFGHHGFVTDLFTRLSPSVKKVFTCGPFPMMKIVAQHCLTHSMACQVSLETHMACGLGACLGCAVHGNDGSYRHVCKHGPVFNAQEVSWNQ